MRNPDRDWVTFCNRTVTLSLKYESYPNSSLRYFKDYSAKYDPPIFLKFAPMPLNGRLVARLYGLKQLAGRASPLPPAHLRRLSLALRLSEFAQSPNSSVLP